MGWFDEQIEYRKKHERELLSDTFENIARSVTGRKVISAFQDDADVSDAVSSLLGGQSQQQAQVQQVQQSGLLDLLSGSSVQQPQQQSTGNGLLSALFNILGDN